MYLPHDPNISFQIIYPVEYPSVIELIINCSVSTNDNTDQQ